MKSEIIINAAIHETRIAIREDSKLVEIWVERPDNERMVGDIYKGTVKAVIPGIQAAFVDIGMEKSAFLHASDVSGASIDFSAQYEVEEEEDEEEEDEEEEQAVSAAEQRPPRKGRNKGGRGRDHKFPPIESIIKKDQEILVQITKEPISTKGARVTSEISLPGRFLVLVPGGSKIGVSRKIESWGERKRLKLLAQKYRQKGFGLIIRTVAEGKGEEEIANEVRELVSAYDELKKKADSLPPPAVIHKEMGMTSGIIRDLLSEDVERVLVDSRIHYEEIRKYLAGTSPSLMNKVSLYTGKEPIFDHHEIEKEIEYIFNRKIWLKKGGFLVFDHAEALSVIDVNSGRYVGKSNQDETIINTNTEAALEIARQLRLRDIGGIIVIDFIDMHNLDHRRRVEDAFADALKNDRSKISISQISEFGIMEMTRQRVRPSLIHTFAEPCPTCGGVGMVQGRDTTVTKIERWLKRAEAFGREKSYTAFVHPAVFEFLIDNNEERLIMLRSSTSLEIDLVVDAKIAIEEFHCFSTTRAVDVTDEFQTQTRHEEEKNKAEKPSPQAPEPLKSFARPVEGDKFGRKPKARRKR
ncbi:MAG: Rne/Rng family ribonuclease [Candidatus Latescibacter sp.]|nr:Rne/Rng family ribonuclease [Candidatus Latescibacter sp.]